MSVPDDNVIVNDVPAVRAEIRRKPGLPPSHTEAGTGGDQPHPCDRWAARGSVPNAFCLKNRLRFLCERPPTEDPTHLQHFSRGRLSALLSARFTDVKIEFVASRFLRLSPQLFGNTMLFTARFNG